MIDESGRFSSISSLSTLPSGAFAFNANLVSGGGGVYLSDGTPLFEEFPKSPMSDAAPGPSDAGPASLSSGASASAFYLDGTIISTFGGEPHVVAGPPDLEYGPELEIESSGDGSVFEGTTASFEIDLEGAESMWDGRTPLVVHYHTEPGSLPAANYEPVSGTVVFGPNFQEGDNVIKLRTDDDGAITGAKTVRLVIDPLDDTSPISRAQIGPGLDQPPYTITIGDAEHPDNYATVDYFLNPVAPGDSSMTVDVDVSGLTNDVGPVSVSYHTEDVTAQAGKDYQAVSGTLSFAPSSDDGESPEQSFQIPILNDNEIDQIDHKFGRLVFSVSTNAILSSYIGSAPRPEAYFYLPTHQGPYEVPAQQPSINKVGTTAFEMNWAEQKYTPDQTELSGVFTKSQGDDQFHLVADTSGPYSSFGPIHITDSGVVYFYANLDAGGDGIFTGPDPVTDKIVATGDVINGRLVSDVTDQFDVADDGDIAFAALSKVDYEQTVYLLSNGTRSSNTIHITTPDTHSQEGPAHSQSMYVGVEGTSTGIHDPIYVQALDASMNVLSQDAVLPDSSGRWDAVVFGGPKAVEVRALESADNSVSDTVYVTARPAPPGRLATDYALMHKGDLVISEGTSLLQKKAYGADFTHVSIYVGPDENGTPMIVEAILESFGWKTVQKRSFGEVVKSPLDVSEAFVDRAKAAIYTRPGVTEAQRDAIASFALKQTGKPYWVSGFALMYRMGVLYHSLKYNKPKIKHEYALDALKLGSLVISHDTYICSTLAKSAYQSALGIDISTPNFTPLDPASIAGTFGQAFWDDLKRRGLLCFPDTIARSGVLTRER